MSIVFKTKHTSSSITNPTGSYGCMQKVRESGYCRHIIILYFKSGLELKCFNVTNLNTTIDTSMCRHIGVFIFLPRMVINGKGVPMASPKYCPKLPVCLSFALCGEEQPSGKHEFIFMAGKERRVSFQVRYTTNDRIRNFCDSSSSTT